MKCQNRQFTKCISLLKFPGLQWLAKQLVSLLNLSQVMPYLLRSLTVCKEKFLLDFIIWTTDCSDCNRSRFIVFQKTGENDKNKQQFILDNICKLHVHLD